MNMNKKTFEKHKKSMSLHERGRQIAKFNVCAMYLMQLLTEKNYICTKRLH